MESKKLDPKIPLVASGVIMTLGIAGVLLFSSQNSTKDTTSTNNITPSPSVAIISTITPTSPITITPVTPTGTTPTNTLQFKNGSYEAKGSYFSPGGSEEINVKLTIVSDKVTDVEVSALARNATSKSYQERFAKGIKNVVIGKNLKDLEDISSVSGSSLTPIGFEKAVLEIENKAKI